MKTFTCDCGDTYKEAIPATGNHNYTAAVTTEPTCTALGLMTYTCSVCGDTYLENIPVTNNHSYTKSIRTEATCTAPGIIEYTCSVCGSNYMETIPMTDHTWVHHDAEGHYETITVQEAWDETVYEAHYVCNQCGYDAGINAEAMGVHLFSGDCENYSTKRVPVDTIHHEAIYDEQWVQDSIAYDECTVCGITK